nr:unnamed protein product [Callosobruchus analis]CAI5844147.1 unnamed protein product [Callosobruchus analis]
MRHFRISRELTEHLADRFAQSHYFHYQEGDSEKVTPLKCVTIFLWFAGNEAVTYRDVADRFAISKSTLFKIVNRVTRFLSNLSPEVIQWPSNEQKIAIEQSFREKHFPGVIGVVDGSHIRIDKPNNDPESYFNRKKFHSIQVQAVCDHKKKILDVFIGFPGSVHDSRAFRASSLSTSLAEKCNDFHILGDSGYPCLQHLLTPFRDNGHLTRQQVNYNRILSKNRCVIEHSFGLLKQKFRQLYHVKLHKIENIVHLIRACCVLHNLALHEEFPMEEDDLPAVINVNENVRVENDDPRGAAKRMDIMNNMPQLY